EGRTRVSLFLPQAGIGNIKAFLAVLRYVQDQRKRKKCRVTGFTTTNRNTEVYHGRWWGNEPHDLPGARPRWVSDWVAELIIDYDLAGENVEAAVGRLKTQVHRLYDRYQSPQSEIWIV
ncbi:unnamed protein product, partial [Phaeothamnion confervicola]